MFHLDDNFLQEVGLEALPQNQRQAFLEQVYSSLEGRVGVQLSEGLSDNQLEEFEIRSLTVMRIVCVNG